MNFNAFDTMAHRLLEELDARHDQLLSELDALGARVDEILTQYLPARPEQSPVAELAIDAEELDED